MSMKHTGRYHQAADKKRRIDRQRIKEAAHERRTRMQAERDARKTPAPAAKTTAPRGT